MAFVNETISEKDKARYDSFGFKSPFTDEPVPAWKWTIDRERDIFLVPLGGRGLEASEIPMYWILVWRGNVICFETYRRGRGNYQEGAELWWRITRISMPEKLRCDSEKAIEIIREALDAHGSGFKRDHVIKVHFEEIASPAFIPEVQ